MQIKLKLIFLIAISALLPHSICLAWEYEEGVTLPRPERVNRDVFVTRISIKIDDLNVSISYDIKNSSKEKQAAEYHLYAPLFSWGGVGQENSGRDFPELLVRSPKGDIPLDQHVSAFYGGVPVASVIRLAGYDPLLISKGSDAVVDYPAGKGRATKKMIDRGLFLKSGNQLIPRWRAQVSYKWIYDIPALGIGNFQIEYKARPEFGLIAHSSPRLSALISAHCADPVYVGNMLRKEATNTGEVVYFKYEIPYGVEGDGFSKAEMKVNLNKKILGRTPTVALACSGDDSPSGLLGKPSLVASEISDPLRNISILVISAR